MKRKFCETLNGFEKFFEFSFHIPLEFSIWLIILTKPVFYIKSDVNVYGHTVMVISWHALWKLLPWTYMVVDTFHQTQYCSSSLHCHRL